MHEQQEKSCNKHDFVPLYLLAELITHIHTHAYSLQRAHARKRALNYA